MIKFYILSSVLIILIIIITLILSYFKTVEDFTTIYTSGSPTAIRPKYGITCTQCAPCIAGTYMQNCGGLNQGMCQWCNEGEYSTMGSTSCTQCGDGTQSTTFRNACEPCPVGTAGTGGTCTTTCNNGQEPNSGKTACQPCPAGTAGTGGTCNNCGIGKYQDQLGQTGCKNCGIGKYQDQLGQTECKNCPANKGAGPTSGRTSSSSCQSCSSNQVSAEGEACQTCTHGKHHYGNRCYKRSDCKQKYQEYRGLLSQWTVDFDAVSQISSWMGKNC